MMRVRETTRKEIESRFGEMSDYVKIDYLSSCLKNHLDFDTRKFVLVKLSGLFESKGMYTDAGKAMKTAAEINTSVENKISDYIKATELFIRAGDYDMADNVMKRIFPLVSSSRIKGVEDSIKEIYKIQAKTFIEKSKRKQAIGAYEKLLSFELDKAEKEDIQNKLLTLYEKVGDITQYNKLKQKTWKLEL